MHGRARWPKTGWLPFLIVGALALASPVRAQEDAAAEVRAALTRWMEAFNAGAVDRVCDLFAPDLIATFQGAPDRDHATFCRQLQAAVANPDLALRYDLEIEEIIVQDDLAVARVIWTLTTTIEGSQAQERTIERGIDIFRRQADGTWKIARFIAYTQDS